MNGIVLFLNGARGVAVAGALARAGHGVVAAVVSEGRPSNDPIMAAWQTRKCEIIAAADVNEDNFVHRLTALSPKLLLIAGFPQILKAPVRAIARHGAINLHAGRVPEYRGGSPLNWQIINGEASAGISILAVDDGIDTGDVMARDEVTIGPTDTIADLHERANVAFAAMTVRVIADLERDASIPERQDSTRAIYWHQRNREDGRIFWDRATAREVHDLVRAVGHPYPGAFCFWGSRRVTILAASVPQDVIRGMPGRICHIQGRGPFVVCSDRAILLDKFEIDGAAQTRLPAGIHFTPWPVIEL